MSTPNSSVPFGTVWKSQACSPVRTSQARTQPGTASFVMRRSATAEPWITLSRTTIGGEWMPYSSAFR